MEVVLELGLELPNSPSMKDKIKPFSSSSDHRQQYYVDTNNDDCAIKMSSTSLIMLLSKYPDDDEDGNEDRRRDKKRSSNSYIVNKDVNDEVVGWPPINSWREKVMHIHGGGGSRRRLRNDEQRVQAARRMHPGGNQHVKVKMEGVAIGRKINLPLYSSYAALLNALIALFSTNKEGKENDGEYEILYQDEVGDWLLAGDHVPWLTFVESTRSLDMVKKRRSEKSLGDDHT